MANSLPNQPIPFPVVFGPHPHSFILLLLFLETSLEIKLNARLTLFFVENSLGSSPHKSRLIKFFVSSNDLLCPLCKTDIDSISHLFFKCSFARIAWRNSFWPLDSLAWATFDMADWIKGLLSPSILSAFPQGTPTSSKFLLQFCVTFFGLAGTKLFMRAPSPIRWT
ncbi:hypothetical protein SLA2020_390630 [Shorea laevis]